MNIVFVFFVGVRGSLGRIRCTLFSRNDQNRNYMTVEGEFIGHEVFITTQDPKSAAVYWTVPIYFFGIDASIGFAVAAGGGVWGWAVSVVAAAISSRSARSPARRKACVERWARSSGGETPSSSGTV